MQICRHNEIKMYDIHDRNDGALWHPQSINALSLESGDFVGDKRTENTYAQCIQRYTCAYIHK